MTCETAGNIFLLHIVMWTVIISGYSVCSCLPVYTYNPLFQIPKIITKCSQFLNPLVWLALQLPWLVILIFAYVVVSSFAQKNMLAILALHRVSIRRCKLVWRLNEPLCPASSVYMNKSKTDVCTRVFWCIQELIFFPLPCDA